MNFQAAISSFSSQLADRGQDSRNIGMIFAVMVCILAPLEISQLAFALIGALAYAVLQGLNPRSHKSNCQLAAEREQRARERSANSADIAAERPSVALKGGVSRPRPAASTARPSSYHPRPDVYQPSTMPIFAPKFNSSGWEAEVSELVSQLTPGEEEEQAVQRLVLHVRQTIQAIFPSVEVSGFAHGSLKCGKAFGVAVPEVDIVANISPVVLSQRLQQRCPQLDVKKLHKSAIRMCTDRLVASAGLKFRRSGFRGEEPRVTLLVPSHLGFFTDAIPVDFSINSVTPFYTAALLTECGQIEPRAKALILLVKRWAKDRGICHAAKGHLSPYIWSLLVIYFLQVGVEEEGALLPMLEAFKISSNLMTSNGVANIIPKDQTSSSSCGETEAVKELSVAQLFCRFVAFYGQHFKWSKEAVSIRLGRRAAPSLSLPLHIVLREDGITSDIGPTIEDPFKAANNLGSCMNTVSLTRLHEELTRAVDLCTRGSSLTQLLEPWVPAEEVPERSSGSSPGEQDEDHRFKSSRKPSSTG